MKHLKTLLIFLMLVPAGFSQELIPIEQFGEDGSQAATFLGEPLAPEFYAKSQMSALADGRNYAAVWALPAQTAEETVLDIQLFIANLADGEAQIVVSAEKAHDIRTFVVPVPAAEEVGLDVSALAGFDQLFLISTTPVSAVILTEPGESERNFVDLEVQPPRIDLEENLFSKSTNYCSSQFGKAISLCGFDTIANTWNCVTAYAYRTNNGSGNFYYLDVHYPTFGAVFHSGVGSFQQTATCKSSVHTTYASSTNKSLTWYGMADLMVGVSTSATARNFSNHSEFWYISPL